MYGLNVESIERFAALTAKLDDGLTPRARLLGAEGLDEGTYAGLQRRWLPLLAAEENTDLALRFARAYARARQEAFPALGADASVCDDADTERGAPAYADVAVDVDCTVDAVVVGAAPVLPFKQVAASDHGPPAMAPRPRSLVDATEATLEVPGAQRLGPRWPGRSGPTSRVCPTQRDHPRARRRADRRSRRESRWGTPR